MTYANVALAADGRGDGPIGQPCWPM